jgi:hypothetical protein
MQKIVIAVTCESDDKELTAKTIQNALNTEDIRTRYKGVKVESISTAEQTATEDLDEDDEEEEGDEDEAVVA